MITNFCQRGRASTVVGGQFGSEAKGSAVAWLTSELIQSGRMFDIVTANNGSQSGHTSIHGGKKRVLFHLPTAPIIARDSGIETLIYLNAGSVIDAEVLEQELQDNEINVDNFFIHPDAAVITAECKAEERDANSSTTKIASTRKGVGAALARKVMRRGITAADHHYLRNFVRRIDLNGQMLNGRSVLVEIPQGVSLSLNHSGFYPTTTSRDCTPTAALSDAGIHPNLYHDTLIVMRSRPIRVGHIVEDGKVRGESGGCYPDQHELSWGEVGAEAEITTVTQRVRRVFTFSKKQLMDVFSLCRPGYFMLTFCNYVDKQEVDEITEAVYTTAKLLRMPRPAIFYEWGKTTNDIGDEYKCAMSLRVDGTTIG